MATQINKLESLKTALRNGDKNTAILLAKTLPIHLGAALKKDIDIASQCIKNPSFYASVGTDINFQISTAFDALKAKILG
jgi:hypothetical protein